MKVGDIVYMREKDVIIEVELMIEIQLLFDFWNKSVIHIATC